MDKRETTTEGLTMKAATDTCRRWLKQQGVQRTATHQHVIAHLEIWELCLKVPDGAPTAGLEPPLIRLVDNGWQLRVFVYQAATAEQLNSLWQELKKDATQDISMMPFGHIKKLRY